MRGSKEDKTSLAWVVKELSSSKYGPECNQDPWPVELVCCLMSGQSQRLARCWQSALKCFRYLGSPTVTGVVDTGLLYSQVIARVCLQPNLQTVWFQLANTFCNTSNKELCKMEKFSEVRSYRSCTFEFLCSNLAAPMRIRQFCTKLRSGQAENIPVLVSKHLLAKWPQASPVAMREGSHISNSSIYFGSIISLCSMHGWKLSFHLSCRSRIWSLQLCLTQGNFVEIFSSVWRLYITLEWIYDRIM